MSSTTTPSGPMQLPATWNKIASAYASEVTRQMSPFAAAAVKMSALAPAEHVLDIAAGPGTLAFMAARVAERVVAVDFSSGMVHETNARAEREGVTNVHAAVMDAQSLAFEDASFDVAFCVFGAMFFPDRPLAFREMLRVLRPGGRAVVVTWSPIDRRPLMSVGFDAMEKVFPTFQRPAKGDLQHPDECVSELSAAGFVDVVAERVQATVRFDPEQYVRSIVRASPLALAREKMEEEAFRASEARLLEEIRRHIPDSGADLAAEAILTRGARP